MQSAGEAEVRQGVVDAVGGGRLHERRPGPSQPLMKAVEVGGGGDVRRGVAGVVGGRGEVAAVHAVGHLDGQIRFRSSVDH